MEEEIKISKVRLYFNFLEYNNGDKQFNTEGNTENTDSQRFNTGKFAYLSRNFCQLPFIVDKQDKADNSNKIEKIKVKKSKEPKKLRKSKASKRTGQSHDM